MRLRYLGSGASEGFPGIFCDCEICLEARRLGGKNIRTRSQALLDGALLLDFPPDSYYHMLTNKLSFYQVEHILITHSHADHFYPDDLFHRMPPFTVNIQKTLTVYGNRAVKAAYENCDSAEEVSPDIMSFVCLDVFQTYEIGGYRVTPLPANHRKGEECLIYLIEDGKRTLLYAHDTGLFSEAVWDYISGKHLDLVSLDCTTMKEPEGTNHMGLPDNVEVKKRLVGMGCVDRDTIFVLNHFSHNGGWLHEEIEKNAEREGFLASYDGMEIMME